VRPAAASSRRIRAGSSVRSPSTCRKPRHALDPRFRALVERVYVEMTSKPRGDRVGHKAERFPGTGIGTTLTHVSSNLLAGLLEAVSEPPYNGHADLPDPSPTSAVWMSTSCFRSPRRCRCCASRKSRAATSSSPKPERVRAKAETDERKRLFARHLLTYVPLAAHVRRVLDERASAHRAEEPLLR
jgi:NitT/TauT family transport system ATP-binding protein